MRSIPGGKSRPRGKLLWSSALMCSDWEIQLVAAERRNSYRYWGSGICVLWSVHICKGSYVLFVWQLDFVMSGGSWASANKYVIITVRLCGVRIRLISHSALGGLLRDTRMFGMKNPGLGRRLLGFRRCAVFLNMAREGSLEKYL